MKHPKIWIAKAKNTWTCRQCHANVRREDICVCDHCGMMVCIRCLSSYKAKPDNHLWRYEFSTCGLCKENLWTEWIQRAPIEELPLLVGMKWNSEKLSGAYNKRLGVS